MTNQSQPPEPEQQLEAPERIWLTLLDAEIQATKVTREDIEYVRADLLQQPTSERCGECHHYRFRSRETGYCRELLNWYDDTYCNHKCVFPAIGASSYSEGFDDAAAVARTLNNVAATGTGEEAQRDVWELLNTRRVELIQSNMARSLNDNELADYAALQRVAGLVRGLVNNQPFQVNDNSPAPSAAEESHCQVPGCLICATNAPTTGPAEAPQDDPRDIGTKCQRCGTRYKVDVMVSNELWAKIHGGDNLLCGPCIIGSIEIISGFDHYCLTHGDDNRSTTTTG